jgi:hypothetical protein
MLPLSFDMQPQAIWRRELASVEHASVRGIANSWLEAVACCLDSQRCGADLPSFAQTTTVHRALGSSTHQPHKAPVLAVSGIHLPSILYM